MLTFEQFIARHIKHDATAPDFVIDHTLLGLEEGGDDAEQLVAVHVYKIDDDEANDLHACEFDNNGVTEFTLETYITEFKANTLDEMHKIAYDWYCEEIA